MPRPTKLTKPAPAAEPTAPVRRKPAAASRRAAAPELRGLPAGLGNQAILRLLAQRKVQAKLTVGPAHDAYEREADRMADQVLRAPAAPVHNAAPAAQRQAAAPEEELAQRVVEDDELQRMPEEDDLQRMPEDEELQRMPEEDELQRVVADEELQRAPDDAGGSFDAGAEVEGRLAARRGQGSPLPEPVRARMESGFGADFGGVRVHTDAEAGQISRSLQAQAFTHGSDIYMAAGKYHPGAESGQHLLAHELTHVVQQGAAQTGPAQTGTAQRRKANRQTSQVTAGGARAQRLVDSELTQLTPFVNTKRGNRAPHIVALLKEYNDFMHAGRRPDQAQENLLHEAYRLLTAMVNDRLNKTDGKAAAERETLRVVAGRVAQELHYLGQYREIIRGKQLGKGQVNTVWKVLFADGWEAVWKRDSDTVEANVAGLADQAGIPHTRANFGGRNIAMYKMDQLLGTGVIPRTERAVWGGHAGTVMEMVKGRQLANTEINEQGQVGNTTGTDLDYANPDIQRGLSNLQMLDAICGQFDRHGGNVMVETTRGGGIRSIKGIDNDFAFGVKMKLNANNKVSHERGMPRFVDVHVAAIMTRITADDVRQTLAGLLTREEIEATVERFLQAKAYCVALTRFHTSKLVLQWDQKTYDDQMREAREEIAKHGDEKWEFNRNQSGSYLYDRMRQLQILKQEVARNTPKVRVETLL